MAYRHRKREVCSSCMDEDAPLDDFGSNEWLCEICANIKGKPHDQIDKRQFVQGLWILFKMLKREDG